MPIPIPRPTFVPRFVPGPLTSIMFWAAADWYVLSTGDIDTGGNGPLCGLLYVPEVDVITAGGRGCMPTVLDGKGGAPETGF